MLLTATESTAIISTPLTHSKDGICSPKLGDNTPLSKVVFLCPSKLSTGLIRIKSFMVVCIEQPFIRLTVPLFGTANLIQSTSRKFAVLRGGLFSKQGINHMNTHAQKPLNISVSHIKDPETLDNIINEIFRTVGTCQFAEKNALEYGELSRLEVESLKRDAEYLINACDKALRTPRPPKDTLTSRFNVLAKDTRRLLASHVTFEKAMKCRASEETIIKFAGMVGGIA